MTRDEAVSFVREHGVVLASAKGPVPNLAETIAGEPIRGSWWGHPAGRKVFALLREIEEMPDVLVCRLVNGKISFVHRRLWPALVRAAARFPPGRLARVHQEHSAEGHHVNREIPFPDWVPPDVAAAAEGLDEAAALDALGGWTSGAKR